MSGDASVPIDAAVYADETDEAIRRFFNMNPETCKGHQKVSNISLVELKTMAQRLGIPTSQNKAQLVEAIRSKAMLVLPSDASCSDSDAVAVPPTAVVMSIRKLCEEDIAKNKKSKVSLAELKTMAVFLGLASSANKPELLASVKRKVRGVTYAP
jgi:hypothetical protein